MAPSSAAQLSQKDAQFRQFALEGNLWKVLWKVCIPLATYHCITLVFALLDSLMAAHIGPEAISTVACFAQILFMLSSIGIGLSVGGGIQIAAAYGAGDYERVKQTINTLFALCAVFALLLGLLFPFARPFLRLIGTPEGLIEGGLLFFRISLIGRILETFNNVYIAVERSRGKTARIMALNFSVILLKLSLTAVFVYGMHGTITHIAIATAVSQAFLFTAGFFCLRRRNDVFGLSLSHIRMDAQTLRPLFGLSIPVILEKAFFYYGKVVVNTMSASYGDLTIGALGISNNLGGITTSPQEGFQDGSTSIISQNIGGGRLDRAMGAFKRLLVIEVTIGLIGCVLTLALLPMILRIFAGEDLVFAGLIGYIYRWEAFALAPTGIFSAVMALLYGFGYTRLAFLVNFSRLFIFRIPVLWLLQNFTGLGWKSVGIVMFVSNTGIGLFSLLILALVLWRMRTQPPGLLS
ncbi:MATE family efflux transporter [Anaerotruncus rubiinfantis]|uniref:MATE family efflux transporter n=1 Tax=Anaerotruncus rubiinfantis TaxID=1720200 RepID=UPI00189C3098|nr:MATE family efflux transporter [Anaerotruncus rubiinfantis]